jgi:hypothetical protein
MREKEERWKELCRQASVEKDPAKLSRLIEQINEALERPKPLTGGASSHDEKVA